LTSLVNDIATPHQLHHNSNMQLAVTAAEQCTVNVTSHISARSTAHTAK